MKSPFSSLSNIVLSYVSPHRFPAEKEQVNNFENTSSVNNTQNDIPYYLTAACGMP